MEDTDYTRRGKLSKIDVLSEVREESTSRKSGYRTENKEQLLEINKPQ